MEPMRNGMTISRRNMVKYLAAGGAGIAALGLLGGCSSENTSTAAASASSTHLPETWDEEADVVVVGFGGAGASAAAKAAETGTEVLILEKMPEELAGGDTSCNSGYVGAGQPADTYLETSAYTLSPEAAAKLGEDTTAAQEWVASLPGIKMNERSVVEGGAPALYETLKEYCIEAGARALYETPAIELVFDPTSKEIKGVYAQQGASTIAVKARKAVILSCGDYAASPEMLGALHYPRIVSASTGTPAATGDGLIMAAAVGAKLDHLNNVSIDWAGLALRTASEEMGTGFLYNYAGIGAQSSTTSSKLFVNYEGKRFMNEETLLAHTRDTSAFPMFDVQYATGKENNGYSNMPMFLVMDSKCLEAEPLMLNEGTGWRIKKNIYQWSEDNKAEVDKGWIIQADTLEELASKMESADYMSEAKRVVPAEALAATVEEYNAGCAAGSDAYDRASFQALDTPPYYAVEIIPCCMYTIGGLAGDEQARVLDWNDEPITRLYRAGNVGQGVEFSPIGVSGCIGQGLVAGVNAAALDSWDSEEA